MRAEYSRPECSSTTASLRETAGLRDLVQILAIVESGNLHQPSWSGRVRKSPREMAKRFAQLGEGQATPVVQHQQRGVGGNALQDSRKRLLSQSVVERPNLSYRVLIERRAELHAHRAVAHRENARIRLAHRR